ncbi:glycosyltransferase [Echinicola salinicaeni]|uniref:glycosyltransferase n=1 Tax=Echinicola salinicaeni TaxID=2762757 RepID=UPI001649524C|nr:glycosyltransferase [Echinicola salinicaeni]
MKILIVSIGTRGDMEPFLAVGQLLRKRGHQVIAVFPAQFEDLVKAAGLEFRSLGSEFLDMLETDAGKRALGTGGPFWKKIPAFIHLAFKYGGINKQLIIRQAEIVKKEQPDRIIRHAKAVYPVLWSLDNHGKVILLSPIPYIVHLVKDRAHIAFAGNYGLTINRITYWIAMGGLTQTIKKSAAWLNKKCSTREIRKAVLGAKTIYTISPQIFERPDYWPENVKVLGYQERKSSSSWEIDTQLDSFIEKHEKVLFVTFGSMVNPSPKEKTRVLIEVIHKLKIPTVINIAAGGLIIPELYDRDLVYFVNDVPYDWILPRMYAMVHHGGSGTTHLSLKHGCASMIIPHIIDQYMWNGVLSDLGVGPKGMDIGDFKLKQLEIKLNDLWGNPSYKKRAKEISIKMAMEDFDEEIIQTIVDD